MSRQRYVLPVSISHQQTMSGSDDRNFWYPSVADILTIHEDIIAEDDDAEPGVKGENRIQFALDFIQYGHFGEVPETIHKKAFHLMRLISSNHWFVDGNKRTALNSTELFYLVNGYELDYGEDIRSMLKLFSVREGLIDRTEGATYLADQTALIDIDDVNPWSALIVVAAVALANYLDDFNFDDYESRSKRDAWGLTTFDTDGTINNDGNETEGKDGG